MCSIRIIIKQCTVYIVHCTLLYYNTYTTHSVQCTVYGLNCTVYNVQCTLNSVHCTIYSLNCTLYSLYIEVYQDEYLVFTLIMFLYFTYIYNALSMHYLYHTTSQLTTTVNVEHKSLLRSPVNRSFDLWVENKNFYGRNSSLMEMNVCARLDYIHLSPLICPYLTHSLHPSLLSSPLHISYIPNTYHLFHTHSTVQCISTTLSFSNIVTLFILFLNFFL